MKEVPDFIYKPDINILHNDLQHLDSLQPVPQQPIKHQTANSDFDCKENCDFKPVPDQNVINLIQSIEVHSYDEQASAESNHLKQKKNATKSAKIEKSSIGSTVDTKWKNKTHTELKRVKREERKLHEINSQEKQKDEKSTDQNFNGHTYNPGFSYIEDKSENISRISHISNITTEVPDLEVVDISSNNSLSLSSFQSEEVNVSSESNRDSHEIYDNKKNHNKNNTFRSSPRQQVQRNRKNTKMYQVYEDSDDIPPYETGFGIGIFNNRYTYDSLMLRNTNAGKVRSNPQPLNKTTKHNEQVNITSIPEPKEDHGEEHPEIIKNSENINVSNLNSAQDIQDKHDEMSLTDTSGFVAGVTLAQANKDWEENAKKVTSEEHDIYDNGGSETSTQSIKEKSNIHEEEAEKEGEVGIETIQENEDESHKMKSEEVRETQTEVIQENEDKSHEVKSQKERETDTEVIQDHKGKSEKNKETDAKFIQEYEDKNHEVKSEDNRERDIEITDGNKNMAYRAKTEKDNNQNYSNQNEDQNGRMESNAQRVQKEEGEAQETEENLYDTISKIIEKKDAISRDDDVIPKGTDNDGNKKQADSYKNYWVLEYSHTN